jgi:hypothetical protein
LIIFAILKGIVQIDPLIDRYRSQRIYRDVKADIERCW